MSAIIYGPQGCGKTSNAVAVAVALALACYLGLTRIIDNGKDEDGVAWEPNDRIMNNTLVLTNIAGIDGALDFFSVKAEMDAHNQQAKDDLVRDLLPFVNNRMGRAAFELGEVMSFLRITALDSRFSPLLGLMIGEVLIDLGCVPVSRAYDRFKSWYLAPSKEDVSVTGLSGLLKPFVDQQTADFTIEDVARFLEFTSDMLIREVRIGLAMILCEDLGCIRI